MASPWANRRNNAGVPVRTGELYVPSLIGSTYFRKNPMAPWFRLYCEVVDDPKVQELSPETFQGWINVLCLAGKNKGVLPSMKHMMFSLRRSEADVKKLLEELIACGLLDRKNDIIQPHNWQNRQFVSDSSTERVKRFRQRSRNVSNSVSATLDETDQIQIQKQIQSPFKNPYQKKVN